MALRLTRRVQQHVEFISLLISEPNTTLDVLRENGFDTSQSAGTLDQLSRREERKIIQQVKERVNGNGTDHS
jgi:hypothetical protein